MEWVCISEDLPQLKHGRVSVTVLAKTDAGETLRAFYRYRTDEFGEDGEWFHEKGRLLRSVVVAWQSV